MRPGGNGYCAGRLAAGGESAYVSKGESQVLVRIYRSIVDAHFIVKMGPGRAATQTNVAYRIATLYTLAGNDSEIRKMPEAGRNAVAVIDNNGASVSAQEIREDHGPIGRRDQRRSERGRN